MENIMLYNDKNQRHGYWEIYWHNNNLMFKGNYLNGKEIGVFESYFSNGNPSTKTVHLNNNQSYSEVNNSFGKLSSKNFHI